MFTIKFLPRKTDGQRPVSWPAGRPDHGWLHRSTLLLIIIRRRRRIAFKGAIRDVLQSPHSAANCLQHVRSSGPGAIVCKSRATHRALITCKCHVTCHLVRRDSSAISLTELKSHLFELYLLAEPLHRRRTGRNRCTRRKPLVTSFRKCHILKPEDSCPKRDSNPCSSIGGRLGKQTC